MGGAHRERKRRETESEGKIEEERTRQGEGSESVGVRSRITSHNCLFRSVLELQPVQVDSSESYSLLRSPFSSHPPSLSALSTCDPGAGRLSQVCCVCVPATGGASAGRAPAWTLPQRRCSPCLPGEGQPAGAVAAESPEKPGSRRSCRFIHHAGQRGAATPHLPGKTHPPGDRANPRIFWS